MLEEQWLKVCGSLEREVGVGAYKSWIAPLKLDNIEGSVAKLTAPTVFIGNWVLRNYGEKICKGFQKENIHIDRLEFNTVEIPRTKKQTLPISHNKKSMAFQKASDVLLPSSPLDKRFTFSNFVVGKPNELAHAAARRVAETGPVTFNPLFLYGGVGLGKTHLMHAIAWEVKRRLSSSRIL
jgi:chromosomal replication initiator protein